VETLSQMLRLAESLRGRSAELRPRELADSCVAAARVRFYDPGLFADTLGPALERGLRGGLSEEGGERLGVGDVVEVLGALASLNAASALPGVFAAAAKALGERSDGVDAAQLKLLRDIYSSAGREGDLGPLLSLAPAAAVAAQQEVRGSTREGTTADGLPMRPGARICEGYLKTGHCRGGASCRWDHPEDLRVRLNSEGFPVRPWAPTCPYYMAMGTCDYRKTCKWHHPDKRERKAQGLNYAWIPKGGMG